MGVLDPLLLLVAAMGVSMTGVMLHEKPAFPDAAASVYPLLTCFLPMSMFMMMMNSTYGVVPGIALITMAFAIAYAGDGAAYFGGRALGRHKLCPNVSPKKTVEGAIGGIVGAAVLGFLYGTFFKNNMIQVINPGVISAAACAMAAVISMVGDLTASAIKRNYEIKDYGTLIPGHGGIFDRIDGMIFAAPLVALVLRYGFLLF